MPKMLLAAICLVVWGGIPLDVRVQATTQEELTKESLENWLRHFPAADANQDGVLTAREADAYRRRLLDQKYPPGGESGYGFRTAFAFATMSDGVKIALAIGYPNECDPKEVAPQWPAIFEMMGYADSTVPRNPGDFNDRYVTVRASVRGAGASGGTIHAISPLTGKDGYEVIEDWIVKQPWSNGRVAWRGRQG